MFIFVIMISELKKRFEKDFGVNPVIPYNVISENDKLFEVSDELMNIKFKIQPISMGLLLALKNKPTHPLIELNKNKIKNYIILNDKSSFLFTCNRKLLKKGIVEKKGNGPTYAAMNKKREVLGVIRFKNKIYSNVDNIGYYLEQDKLKKVIF